MRFTRTRASIVVVVICALTVCASSVFAEARAGLLIIAHGAPSPEWNQPVRELGKAVEERLKGDDTFKCVRTAFLEFAKDNVPSAVAALEAEGCDRIVAVPLFIAPSSHTHFDVPAALGLYSSPSATAMILAEGGSIARPHVPITLTATLAEGDLLCQYALEQVRELSSNPKEEALVLIAHGCPDHERINTALMRRVAAYCCGRTGIDYADWASVEMGQSFAEDGISSISQALEHKKRIIVVGIYVVSTADDIYKGVMKSMQNSPMFKAMYPTGDPFRGREVVFSKKGVISHTGTIQWVIDVAHSALPARAQ